MSVIEHTGTITNINGEIVTVEITSKSACAACHLKDGCSIFECKHRFLEIYTPTPELYQSGQTVTVTIDENRGWIAVFFAYILPLLLVLGTLVTVWNFTSNETTSAICSLIALIPYYLLLMLFKKTFAGRFSFKIKT